MRKTIFCVGMVAMFLAQGQAKLMFEKEIHDFGKLKEVDGSAEYSFAFVNTGDQPLKINGVKTSCGCTTPYWTKEEVLPGDSGRVTARYNTVNRPGPFSKSLTVSSNAENYTVRLIIKGQVQPKPSTPENDLPITFGAIRMKYRSLNVGKITTERVITESFEVYNESDSSVTFYPENSVIPDHLVIRAVPEILESKQRGELRITYDPLKKNDLGYLNDLVTLSTSDPLGKDKKIYVIATIEEYFPMMTDDELATKPKLLIDERIRNLGKVPSGENAELEFLLKNEGQETLNIRKVKSNCDCLALDLVDENIQVGETVSLKVTFDTKGRKGQQYKNVTIFSNDPSSPTQVVQVRANVQD